MDGSTHPHTRGQPFLRALDDADHGPIFDAAGDSFNGEPANVFKDIHQDQPPPMELQHQRDSAGWQIRKTIIFAEAVVVTAIVGTVLYLCLRKQRRRVRRRRVGAARAARALQDWATIRVLPPGFAAASSRGDGDIDLDIDDQDIDDLLSIASSSRNGRSIVRMIQQWATIRVVPPGFAAAAAASMAANDVDVASDGPARRARIDSGIGGMSVGPGGGARARVDSGIGGMSVVGPRDGRIRADSGISGMVAPSPAVARQEDGASHEEPEEVSRAPSAVDRLLSVPRAIGHVLMYPLRMLEAGVNEWATEDHDEVFLRQFMERLEQEREAAMENPEEREVRLKEAFAKECMVWELDEENFIPPEPLFELNDVGGKEQGGEDDTTAKSANENMDNEVGYGLYTLGEVSEDVLEDAEDGKINDDHAQETHKFEANVDDSTVDGESKEAPHLDKDPEKAPEESFANAIVNDDTNPEACQESAEVASGPTSTMTSADENATCSCHEATSTEQLATNERNSANDTNAEQPSSSPPDMTGTDAVETRPRSVSDPTLPSMTPSAVENTFDLEASPGFLYLNTSGHRRRGRANTGGSSITDASSSNHSGLSSTESMESVATASLAPSTTQDSHKIPNECAICLCEYEKGDTVVTSCDSECPHAFHQECIVEWLVKMQEGTPCPCCRRQFVELHEPGNPRSNNNGGSYAHAAANNNSNSANERAQEELEEARLREERERQNIELGLRRGGRAFNTSVISMRGPSANSNNVNAVQDPEEVERLRQERRRQYIELGIRRGGRAFNTSLISMR